ncbi:hypothetical protein DCAR_0207139 [Daucus carota subsp. sativus]|uniref:Transcription factor CBF/NF-Y/archaeal histone domain-containing protein n=1 Tax=Daucus carota subsp. sativus TaxID=79200 RepID=A0AAF0WEJ1_DAUCS|nr:hypothetical protein DCAR_0207139 [Daucus carota subsp. sativus]
MKRTHEERENFECHENSSEQRISYDLVPAPNVTGLMRRIIPNQGEISADAVISIQQCVIKFIRYVTAEANTRCGEGMRTTITAHDVLIALNKLGFHHYIGPLFIYMNRLQEFQPEQGDPLVIRRTLFQPRGMGIGGPGFDVEGVMTMGGFVGDDQNDAPSGSAAHSTGDA